MFGSCIFNFGLYTFKRFILLLVFVRSDYFGRFKMKMNRQKWSIFNSIETRHFKTIGTKMIQKLKKRRQK